MEQLKAEDPHFRLEYAGQDTLHIQLAELTFTNMLTLDLGQLTARIFHTVSLIRRTAPVSISRKKRFCF